MVYKIIRGYIVTQTFSKHLDKKDIDMLAKDLKTKFKLEAVIFMEKPTETMLIWKRKINKQQ